MRVFTDCLESRAVFFNYGASEGEPTLPLTNFGGDNALRAGRATNARGVVGNAQTHCLQLPNIFAFSRGFTAAGIATLERHQDQNRKWDTHSVRVLAALEEIADRLERPP